MNSPADATLALLKKYYQTFNSGDREAFLELLHEDVVHDINQGSSETGKIAFTDFLTRMDQCYEEQVEDLQVFANPDGSRGSAEFYIRGRYLSTDEGLPPATGQVYRLRVGAFFEICEGKILRITNYYNLQEWLAQIGACDDESEI